MLAGDPAVERGRRCVRALDPVRAFLTVSILLPVAGLLLFVSSIPVVVDDAAGAELETRPRVPVVLVVFDEFPVSSLMTATANSTSALPELRTTRSLGYVVPAGNDGPHPHGWSGTGDSLRAARESR